MVYKVLSLVFGIYLIIAILVAVYLRKEIIKQLDKIEKMGECKMLLVGMTTTAVFWPIWLVKLFIIGFKYVAKGE